jgi:alkylation response protein AidB-like acyl-CoA dehydrogenase
LSKASVRFGFQAASSAASIRVRSQLNCQSNPVDALHKNLRRFAALHSALRQTRCSKMPSDQPEQAKFLNRKGTNMSAVAAAQLKSKAPQSLPAPNGDFYGVIECLNEAERNVLKQVRAFMEANVAPVITKYWAEDSFPFEVLPGFRALNIAGLGYEGYGCRGGSTLLMGFVLMEMARVDPSFSTFFGVHNGLAKAEVAPADGPHGKDRLVRVDRTACWLGHRRRAPDHRQARGRHLGAERPEEMDR